MKKPRGMLFDLGDTILALDSLDWIHACRKILEHQASGPPVSAEEFQTVANQVNAEFNQVRIDAMIEQDVMGFYRLICDTLGITLSVSYEEAALICWHNALQQSLEKGVPEVLDTLDKHGIKAGILSNTSFPGICIAEELEKHGIKERFSCIVSSADYAIRKPHPRIFDVAARKLGIDPADIWFAGDKPAFDVKGALAAGMYPIWYNKLGLPSEHGYDCLEIKNWFEFIDIIDSL